MCSEAHCSIFGNWQTAGGGLVLYGSPRNQTYIDLHDGNEFVHAFSGITHDATKYYTLIGTYDGTNLNFYLNGELTSSIALSQVLVSECQMVLGANPDSNGNYVEFTNMVLKEAMLYDRALTQDEIKTITEGFETKYQ